VTKGSRRAVFLSLFALGCPARTEKTLVYDLVERFPVAELWSSRETLLFGTPGAEPHQVEGFYREAGAPAGDPFLWAREEAEVSLTWSAKAPRAGLVDLAPYRDLPSQAVEVLLNGQKVASFPMNGVRQRYSVPLPIFRPAPHGGPDRR
jgi:hypothetical protein